ncbi:hypothetical protein [Candidatus Arthromitus sp. SFB-turkey]|uniref:hypothetical protein n=1 Tax=Candidatus Arthromitus sp. SFB-turkey TaxID=1840217 RepID=UPI0009ED7199|nr:hypothetical protein [Candidatus Arthromitus sp. SFB-turkey]
MSFIHLYLDKDNDSNDELINLLKNYNIDFLQHNIKNNETYISAYELESLPAIKFKDSIIHDINKESIKTIVDKFNNFINTLPSIKSNDTFEEKPNIEEDSEKSEEEIIDNENKTTPNQILVDTIKISDKEKLSSYIKDFAEKHKN